MNIGKINTNSKTNTFKGTYIKARNFNNADKVADIVTKHLNKTFGKTLFDNSDIFIQASTVINKRKGYMGIINVTRKPTANNNWFLKLLQKGIHDDEIIYIDGIGNTKEIAETNVLKALENEIKMLENF